MPKPCISTTGCCVGMTDGCGKGSRPVMRWKAVAGKVSGSGIGEDRGEDKWPVGRKERRGCCPRCFASQMGREESTCPQTCYGTSVSNTS